MTFSRLYIQPAKATKRNRQLKWKNSTPVNMSDCPICMSAPADTVVCWNAHEICRVCYSTCINSERTNNKKCAVCREYMFKWYDATTDPVTGDRPPSASIYGNWASSSIYMAWIPEGGNAGRNLFEMNEWMETNSNLSPPALPVIVPTTNTHAIQRNIREYGKRWRIWAREMVRLGCPINMVEHYIQNVLGGWIRREGSTPVNYEFRVRLSRRNGTVWSVTLQPRDTNGYAIPWNDPILLQY